jgi:hypothetical protein
MDRALKRARREYHRSHLRYYRKHNGLLARGVLRLLLLGRGLAGVARGALTRNKDIRRESWTLIQLALGHV